MTWMQTPWSDKLSRYWSANETAPASIVVLPPAMAYSPRCDSPTARQPLVREAATMPPLAMVLLRSGRLILHPRRQVNSVESDKATAGQVGAGGRRGAGCTDAWAGLQWG